MGLPNEATLIVHLLQDTDKENCDKTERENDENDENAAHKKRKTTKNASLYLAKLCIVLSLINILRMLYM